VKLSTEGILVRASALVLAIGLLLLHGAAASCRLRATGGSWPPYVYPDEHGKPAGLDIELMRAIAGEAGCEVVIDTELPNLRRDAYFREGKLDLLMAASDVPERHQYARFSLPYRMENVRLFTPRNKLDKFFKLDNFATLAQQGVGVLAPNLGWYGQSFADQQENLRSKGLLYTFNSIDQGVRMLAAGRAELILGDAAAIRYQAAMAKLDLLPLPYVVLSAPVRLMLSKASTGEDILVRLDTAIARLEQRGVLKAIRARYGEQ
jgi:polar amino acid transport system substrate-binding protein